MRTMTCAEMRTDLPDDSVWEGDDIVQFGGRNVAAAIQEMIASLGYQVSGPENGDEHGWWLDVVEEGRQYHIQVTDLPPDIILLIDDATFFLNRWFSKNGHLYGEFVSKVKSAVNADPRFHHIRWYEENMNGRELGPDGRPLSTKEVQAQSLARQAELGTTRRPKP